MSSVPQTAILIQHPRSPVHFEPPQTAAGLVQALMTAATERIQNDLDPGDVADRGVAILTLVRLMDKFSPEDVLRWAHNVARDKGFEGVCK